MGEFVLDYRKFVWLELWEDVGEHVGNDDVTEAGNACEAVRADFVTAKARLLSWEESAVQGLAQSLFEAMEAAVTACATGSWQAAQEYYDTASRLFESGCHILVEDSNNYATC